MGANTHTHADTYAYSYAYSHAHTYSYTNAYAHTHTVSLFNHNVDPAYNIDGDPFDHFDHNYQFISAIHFISADHHILNHYNRTLSF